MASPALRSRLLLVLLPLLFSAPAVRCVDRSKFHTCDQTPFCRRHRFGSPPPLHPVLSAQQFPTYALASPLSNSGGVLRGRIRIAASPSSDAAPELDVAVELYATGAARLRLTFAGEETSERYSPDELVFGAASGLVRNGKKSTISPDGDADALSGLHYAPSDAVPVEGADRAAVAAALAEVGEGAGEWSAYGYGEGHVVVVVPGPFRLHVVRGGAVVATVNAGDTLYFDVDAQAPSAPVHLMEEEEARRRLLMENVEDADPSAEAEEHGGIVGYWEDGLAIYADGTREQKKEDAAEEDPEEDDDEYAGNDDDVLDEEEFERIQAARRKDDPVAEESRRLLDEGATHKKDPSTSVGFDIHFPGSRHLHGLPEHADSFRLRTTRGEHAHHADPYRLYNLDVFEYELDTPMALYGSVPIVYAHSKARGTVGAFAANPTETFVDVYETSHGTGTRWMSEGGLVDVLLFPGPTVADAAAQYAAATGTAPVPPMFALGYHQCRWNYRDERDVNTVHDTFERLDYPYDVLWLDIEHTDGKRYFTWDKGLFPDPVRMQKKLAQDGRKMVTIVDPHIKRDNNYHVHKEATRLGLYIKDKHGKKDFDGWCWPGSSSYLDFTSAHVRDWWAEQFAYDKYIGSTPSLYTWNDMNEPSVFNGPEISMDKDLKNLDGVDHRNWHNIYGMLFHRATSEGLVRRNEGHNERPFVLSRAFFAGSQRYGAIWTGDNTADWTHLKVATPMLLSLNIAGIVFSGADVGGFFGNPDAELMTRWTQAGSYQPFFRGHAHHDSKRREPWTFGDETMVRLRKATMARYALLPYLYTVFHQAATSGMPIMRALWMQYPDDEATFDTEDQWLLGSDILVRPVTDPGAHTADVLFPAADLWFDVETMARIDVADGVTTLHRVDAPLDKIPAYQRGGSVVPRRMRLRRSSQLMVRDPYTLHVAPDREGRAGGSLYVDDEHSFDYRAGRRGTATFSFELRDGAADGVLTNVWDGPSDLFEEDGGRDVERVVVMGLFRTPKSCQVEVEGAEQRGLTHVYDSEVGLLTIRKPEVSVMANWEIKIHF